MQEAFRRTAHPDDIALLDAHDRASREGEESERAAAQDRYLALFGALYEAFQDKLRSGALQASGFKCPLEQSSFRYMISADLWQILSFELSTSDAHAHGLSLVAIEVYGGPAKALAERSPERLPRVCLEPAPSHRDDAIEEEFVHAPDYSWVMIRGQTLQLGPIQASVVSQLHVAARSPMPWRYGKQLLQDAKSSSLKLSDLFKRQVEPSWRELIKSDGRGRYRLDLELDEADEQD